MAFPKVGNLAPGFTLKNQLDEAVSLKDFKGKKNVVIYFYPRASTPGCTTQACGIRDISAELDSLDTVVFGISPDAVSKLQKFIGKYDLNFDLLSDEDHLVAEKYGVWGLKKFMGKEFMGILRTSFFVDKNGCLRYIMDKVNTKTHDQDVVAYIKEHF
jgi:peroxiredoxin Q/BCP